MSEFVLTHGRIVDPARGLDASGHLWVKDGRVHRVLAGGEPAPAGVRAVDAAGSVVAPGLVDLHVHLRDPGQTHKEDLASGTRAAVAGGYTSVLAMPNTQPANDSPAVTEAMIERAARTAHCRVYPVGALTRGLAGKEMTDFDALYRAGCRAFSDDGRPCLDTAVFRRAMEAAARLDALVIEHCEDVHLTAGKTTIHEGEVSRRLGFDGIGASSETNDVARSLLLAAETGARLHLAHISCADSMEMIQRMRATMPNLSCEVSPHHLTLTVEAIETHGTAAKMYPPLRTRADVEGLRRALGQGWIDTIATDHAPHAPEEKAAEFRLAPNGVIGLQTALPVMLTLVHEGVLDLPALVRAMSTRPAQVLGIDAGTLREGAAADIVVFSTDEASDLGKMVQYSKSKNTPFAGFTGRGRVRRTFVGGREAYAGEAA